MSLTFAVMVALVIVAVVVVTRMSGPSGRFTPSELQSLSFAAFGGVWLGIILGIVSLLFVSVHPEGDLAWGWWLVVFPVVTAVLCYAGVQWKPVYNVWPPRHYLYRGFFTALAFGAVRFVYAILK